jgi:hypothetical protein
MSVRTLLLGVRPASSRVGMAWLAMTFVVMVVLARGESRVGAQLRNLVLEAEGRVTLVDA